MDHEDEDKLQSSSQVKRQSEKRRKEKDQKEYKHYLIMSRDLDKAFELIEEGNELKKNEKHWQAASKYGEAHCLLEKLATETPSTTDEEQKIGTLYRTKSRHYTQMARSSLIEALEQEKEQDSQSDSILVVSTISMQEAENRIRIFSMLFSRTSQDVGEKTSMLEERLMELNASLPSGFKTDKERLADINRGLGRLGLSLYPNSNHGSSTDIQPPQCEEDQVAEIIAQAKDEVRYEKPAAGETNVHADTSNDVDDSSTEISEESFSEDSISADDLVDEPIFKNRKAIRHKVVKAQVKLAELLALLNTGARFNLSEDADEKGNSNDGGVEEEGAGFDIGYGKATLIAARNYLNKALKELPQDSSDTD